MREKEVTINDAAQVTWYAFWRTFAVLFGLGFLYGVVAAIAGFEMRMPHQLVMSLLSLVIFTYFLKGALNKDYEYGNFRVMVVDKSEVTSTPAQNDDRAADTSSQA